jgi:hypothetical protein
MTQSQKILEVLRRGSILTAPVARSQYGIQNLRARICELRDEGVAIQSVPYVRKNGTEGVKYVLGR